VVGGRWSVVGFQLTIVRVHVFWQEKSFEQEVTEETDRKNLELKSKNQKVRIKK